MWLEERGPIPVHLPRDVVLFVEPSTLGKPSPSFPHLPGANWVREPWGEGFAGFLGGRQVGPPRCPSALTFGVAHCVSMLLQALNIALDHTGAHVGFVVVLLLPEKDQPSEP